MLSLNTIKKTKGSSKKIKRVGRGNASGHGTYSTRGLKGQKSRSGVSPITLFEKKLIGSIDLPVKVLGKEKLTVKVTFEKVRSSEPVKSQIK